MKILNVVFDQPTYLIINNIRELLISGGKLHIPIVIWLRNVFNAKKNENIIRGNKGAINWLLHPCKINGHSASPRDN